MKNNLFSGIFLILVLLFGLGLVIAQDNETDNETEVDDSECTINSDCESDEECINGECEDEEDEVDEEENETEIEIEFENETKDGKAKGKYKVKIKKGLGQVIRGQVKAGEFKLENGENIRVRDLAQNRMALLFNDLEVEIDEGLEIEVEYEEENETENENGTKTKTKTKLKVKLKNGRNAEVKIMPETANKRALERLRLKVCSEDNNCTIELKEVGKVETNESKLAYEVQLERHSRILGIFKSKMKIRTEVDAESGEIIKVSKPWWAWLAAEPSEE